MQVAKISYAFTVSRLDIGHTRLRNGKPFGELSKGKLTFQFPVFLSYQSAQAALPDSIYRAELTPASSGELKCSLTQIEKPDYEYSNFTLDGPFVVLPAPPQDKKIQKHYSLVLKLVSE